ncbi:hypothetical protein C1N32_00255 [Vibrio diazotrophicus]|uniref:Sel1 repeat family protein n=1 Tax=Vibrio diazotrophicus TaxID=685 RepID=A0A2J8I7I6_VIBDI|nr:hypothetical protein [Vibrio diazotrophicus]PNI06480.1 hypothetical protein C1N32_00255 [Vibrio diazotrophicus]
MAVLISIKRHWYVHLFIFFSYLAYGNGVSYEPSQLSSDQAFVIGKLMRSQFKNREAQRYLKYSADNGHSYAAYLYAMELLINHKDDRSMYKSREYLLKAANGDNRDAMKHLYQEANWLTDNERNIWGKRYYNTLIMFGKWNPGKVFYELSEFHADDDEELSRYYLVKSIALSYPRALMKQADSYMKGYGSFYLPGERETVIRKLYFSAAKLDYIPAIKKYIQLLEKNGQFNLAFEWRQRALNLGDITSLASLAFIYSGNFNQNYSFVEVNNAKAKAYLQLYIDNVGNEKFIALTEKVEGLYAHILDRLPQEQLTYSSLIESELEKNIEFYNYDLYWDI